MSSRRVEWRSLSKPKGERSCSPLAGFSIAGKRSLEMTMQRDQFRSGLVSLFSLGMRRAREFYVYYSGELFVYDWIHSKVQASVAWLLGGTLLCRLLSYPCAGSTLSSDTCGEGSLAYPHADRLGNRLR